MEQSWPDKPKRMMLPELKLEQHERQNAMCEAHVDGPQAAIGQKQSSKSLVFGRLIGSKIVSSSLVRFN